MATQFWKRTREPTALRPTRVAVLTAIAAAVDTTRMRKATRITMDQVGPLTQPSHLP